MSFDNRSDGRTRLRQNSYEATVSGQVRPPQTRSSEGREKSRLVDGMTTTGSKF